MEDKNKSKIAYEQLILGIQKYIDERVGSSNKDITSTARIVEIDKNGHGYTILLDGLVYRNIETIGGICKLNETVNILIPQGNYSNMMILKGGTGDAKTITQVVNTGVESVNGKTGKVNLTASDLGAQPKLVEGNNITIDSNNKISAIIPQVQQYTKLSELTDDSNHRLVTDAEKVKWNNKVDKVDGSGLITNEELSQLHTNTNDIYTLKGSGKGSIEDMINTKLNQWATLLTDDGIVNTYAEAINWIATHGGEYTELLGIVNAKMDKSNPSGNGSFSMNRKQDSVVGNYSVALGKDAVASGVGSFAEGSNTVSIGANSHAEGSYSSSKGYQSHAEGGGIGSVGLSNIVTAINDNVVTFENAINVYYYNYMLFIEKDGKYIPYTKIIGVDTTNKSVTVEDATEIEVGATVKFAVGGSLSSAFSSHSEGFGCSAIGDQSHAQNRGTIAGGKDQTVMGRYNKYDTINALVIGNGAWNARSNAMTVDWDGNIKVSGEIIDGNDNLLSNKQDVLTVGENVEITDNVISVPIINAYEKNEFLGLNLFENKYSSDTRYGITYTVNSDKSITVKGTATQLSYFGMYIYMNEIKQGTDYLFSGCPMGGSEDTYKLCISIGYDYNNTEYDCYGEDVTVNFDNKSRYMFIVIKEGITIDETFYPMIRPINSPNKYNKYIPSNETLKTLINSENYYMLSNLTKNQYSSTKIYNIGDICSYNNYLWKCLIDNTKGIYPRESDNWEQCRITELIDEVKSSSGGGTSVIEVTEAEYLSKKEEYDSSDNLIHIIDRNLPLNAKSIAYGNSNVADALDTKADKTENADWLKSKNLFDKNGHFQKGYLLSGNFNPSNEWNTSDYVYVHNISNIVTSGKNTEGINACYDINKNFVTQYNTLSYEIPSNVYYIRFVVHNSELDTYQAEVGTVATSYQPYSMSNVALTPYAQTQSNRNLLDNGWFTVNQRGQTSYSGSDAYTVDRWKIGSGSDATITKGNDYITISGSATSSYKDLFQFLDYNQFVGKTVTLSAIAKVRNGSPSNISIKPLNAQASMKKEFNNRDYEIITLTMNIPSNADLMRVGITLNSGYADSIDVKAIKLELGTVSTIANDVAPNYAEELLKCQRYFVRFRANTGSHGFVLAHPISTTLLRIPLTLPCWMNSNTPTVTLAGSLRTTPSASDAQIVCSGLSRIDMMANVIILQTTISSGSLQIGGNYMMIFADSNTYIDISADL